MSDFFPNFAAEIHTVMGRKTAKPSTKDSDMRHRAAMRYTVSQLTALNDLDLLVEQKVAQLLSPNGKYGKMLNH